VASFSEGLNERSSFWLPVPSASLDDKNNSALMKTKNCSNENIRRNDRNIQHHDVQADHENRQRYSTKIDVIVEDRTVEGRSTTVNGTFKDVIMADGGTVEVDILELRRAKNNLHTVT
jgi:hypothetical protein